jgi:hypothetical protein
MFLGVVASVIQGGDDDSRPKERIGSVYDDGSAQYTSIAKDQDVPFLWKLFFAYFLSSPSRHQPMTPHSVACSVSSATGAPSQDLCHTISPSPSNNPPTMTIIERSTA